MTYSCLNVYKCYTSYKLLTSKKQQLGRHTYALYMSYKYDKVIKAHLS